VGYERYLLRIADVMHAPAVTSIDRHHDVKLAAAATVTAAAAAAACVIFFISSPFFHPADAWVGAYRRKALGSY